MRFIEITDGFTIRIDSITSIHRITKNLVRIETENREYELVADFRLLSEAIDREDSKKEEVEKVTSQYFGG